MLKDRLFKENVIEEYFETVKNAFEKSNSFALFGAGAGGVNTLNWIKESIPSSVGKMRCFFDNNPKKWQTKLMGIEVLRPSEDSLNDIDLLAVTCGEGDAIIEQLREIGLKSDVKVIVPDISVVDRKRSDYEFIYGHLYELEYVYNTLADEKSRRVFENILNYKICHDMELISEIYDDLERQYFDEKLVSFNSNDVFVDCGSYIGDTIEYYKRWSNNRFRKIYALEADEDNYKVLIEKYHFDKRVIPIRKAVWNNTGYLSFNNIGSGSGYLGDDGEITVMTDTIDNIAKEDDVDFIKMDIEGAEYYALLGAANKIEKNHPVLMISVYHKQDDFIRIPLLIKSLYEGYKFYLRHYRKLSVQETVLYAIAE